MKNKKNCDCCGKSKLVTNPKKRPKLKWKKKKKK